MKTLQNIKDEIAEEQGFPNWEDLYNWSEHGKFLGDNLIDLIAERFANAKAKAVLEEAAEKIEKLESETEITDWSKGFNSACHKMRYAISSLIKEKTTAKDA